MTVKEDELYITGFFDTAGGVSSLGIARWNGTNWMAVVTNSATCWAALALGVKDQDLFIGNYRWDGTNATTFAPPGTFIQAMAVAGADIYFGGLFTFTNAHGKIVNNIARWDGTNWYALGSGLTGPTGSTGDKVTDILVQGDDVIVSGYFTHAGGKPSTNFAIWHNQPKLSLKATTGIARLDWLNTPGANYVLESSQNATNTYSWVAVAPPPTSNWYEVPITATNTYFRLRRPLP